MEWAIGKQFDVYPSNTGKLLLPGARIRGMCTITPSANRFATMLSWHLSLSQGVTPKYRTRLMEFHANPLGGVLDIPPTRSLRLSLPCAEGARQA